MERTIIVKTSNWPAVTLTADIIASILGEGLSVGRLHYISMTTELLTKLGYDDKCVYWNQMMDILKDYHDNKLKDFQNGINAVYSVNAETPNFVLTTLYPNSIIIQFDRGVTEPHVDEAVDCKIITAPMTITSRPEILMDTLSAALFEKEGTPDRVIYNKLKRSYESNLSGFRLTPGVERLFVANLQALIGGEISLYDGKPCVVKDKVYFTFERLYAAN